MTQLCGALARARSHRPASSNTIGVCCCVLPSFISSVSIPGSMRVSMSGENVGSDCEAMTRSYFVMTRGVCVKGAFGRPAKTPLKKGYSTRYCTASEGRSLTTEYRPGRPKHPSITQYTHASDCPMSEASIHPITIHITIHITSGLATSLQRFLPGRLNTQQ